VSRKDSKLDLLAGVPLFDRLGKRELRRVGELADVLDFKSGRVLMRQGDTGLEALVIVTGRATVERDGSVITDVGPGAVLGEMALLSSRPRNATVTVTTDGQMLVLGRREFQALMDEMPSVRSQVMECLADRLLRSEGGPAVS
jgi:CRP/FNR family transcriptional regulator, cyclic AMP receptor protein